MILLKNIYCEEFLSQLASEVSLYDSGFDKISFIKSLLSDNWAKKELKERMRAITIALNNYLTPKTLFQKVEILKSTCKSIVKDKNSGLSLIIFPDYIEVHCEEKDYDLAISALEFFTSTASSEFAIRKFIEIDQVKSLKILEKFSKSNNYHVRRLASEGCRPLLPWAKRLNSIKENPESILKILETLKFDSEIYVRRSVANNLNDISKNHPKLVTDLLSRWKIEKVDQYIIKHGLRTLLKQGNINALSIIGIKTDEKDQKYSIKDFYLEKEQLSLGDKLAFSFTMLNSQENNKIRLEYAIYFLKKNGSLNKKIFQITTKIFEKGSFSLKKNHLFKDFSTRKHYEGQHFIELLANGRSVIKTNFDLKIN